MAMSGWSDVVRELHLPETPETILQASQRLKAAGRLGDALSGLEEVVRRDAGHITALREMSAVLRQLGRGREADAVDRRRMAAEADHLFLRAIQNCGRDDSAARGYLAGCEERAPDHAGLPLARALVSDDPSPRRIPDDIVAMLYDHQAARYDWHSRTVWRCRAPALLFETVRAIAGHAMAEMAVADVGCGTGLGAEMLGGLVGRIDGVDLSPCMLERAFRRRLNDDSNQPLYADLEIADGVTWLHRRPGSYDLVLAVDALGSSSDPAPLFAAAAQALRADGLIAFSYESADTPGPALGPRPEFRHNPFTIRRALAAAGLDTLRHEQAVLRYDGHTPVGGGIVIAGRRPPSEPQPA